MIHWAIQVATPPASEPIALADAKNFCRVDGAADDSFLTMAIQGAREYVENSTAMALIATQYLLTLDRFPFPSNYDRALYSQDQFLPIGPTNMPFYDQFAIWLQRNPVTSVDTLKYIDQSGVLQTLAGTEWMLDKVSQQARLLPAFGKAWPIAQYQANAIQVTFTAGAANASGVPASVKHAMLLHVGMQFESRVPGAIDVEKSLKPIDALLEQYRIHGRGME